jgi:hypothetical protein
MSLVNVNVNMLIDTDDLRKSQNVLAELSSKADSQEQMDAIESALGVLAATADAIPSEETTKSLKGHLIDVIVSIVQTQESKTISMAEIEAQSPIVHSIGESYSSVETLNECSADVYTYVNCNRREPPTNVQYWDLDVDVLEEIITELNNNM